MFSVSLARMTHGVASLLGRRLERGRERREGRGRGKRRERSKCNGGIRIIGVLQLEYNSYYTPYYTPHFYCGLHRSTHPKAVPCSPDVAACWEVLTPSSCRHWSGSSRQRRRRGAQRRRGLGRGTLCCQSSRLLDHLRRIRRWSLGHSGEERESGREQGEEEMSNFALSALTSPYLLDVPLEQHVSGTDFIVTVLREGLLNLLQSEPHLEHFLCRKHKFKVRSDLQRCDHYNATGLTLLDSY